MLSTHLRVKENTLKMVRNAKDLFVKVNPEYENIVISDDKIVYEYFKNYGLILEELDKNGSVKVFKK